MANHFDLNRQFWNHRAEQHYDSEFYDNDSFLAGRNPLNAIEMAILGDDLSGQKALHLMCHFGQDTLALERLGAEATGVDLSDTAIEKARELRERAGLNARFIRSNVLEADQHINEQFDLVFSSYGAIGWLPQLGYWGELINKFLKPGGRFVFAEFHPVVWMYDDDFTHFKYPYFNLESFIEESQGSYAAPEDEKSHSSAYWNHSLADVFQALMDAGLTITHFSEYDYSPYDCFNLTVPCPSGFQIKGHEGKMPMVFALEARKN